MAHKKEIDDLEQVRAALSALDLKGSDKSVTKAMTIVAIAKDFVCAEKTFTARDLLSHLYVMSCDEAQT